VAKQNRTTIKDTLRAVNSVDGYTTLAPPTYVPSQPTIKMVISGQVQGRIEMLIDPIVAISVISTETGWQPPNVRLPPDFGPGGEKVCCRAREKIGP
jgi:hypothetical protein